MRTPEQKAAKAAQQRRRYADMTPEQKAARVAHDKAYHETHRAAKAAAGRAYYETHRIAQSAYRKKWRDERKDDQAAQRRINRNRRRAESQGHKVAPDVSAETYARIMAGDPTCTYCPAPATDVDHVYPFDRGGFEADSNLVPACRSCNSGKHARLLTEWAWAKVEYGAAHNPKVAAELDRLVALDAAA
jgi:5-methylcytosine-specific restriction endonuclease McrA